MKCSLHFPKKIIAVISFVFLNLTLSAQDECSAAITLTSNISCNNTGINLASATASASIPLGCAAAGTYNDYWYQFTAVGTTHTVTLSNLGARISNPRVQIYANTCGTLASVACGTLTVTPTGLIIGNSYYIRVSQYGAFSATGNYKLDICVTHPQAPPANDECSGSTLLTSAATCNNTSGTFYYATASSGVPVGCGAGTLYDVWYRFQATSTNHAVTLSSLGGGLTAASTYIQVLSGSCGTYTNLFCAAASSRLVATGLSAGTFYFVRVFTTVNPTVIPSTDWAFNICVQGSPANDECTGAVVLTPGATCVNTAGSLDLATANAATPTATCTGTMFDIWYRFTATGTNHTITASSLGANITNPRIHVYSGTCAALVQFGCASSGVFTSAAFINTVTYYVRVSNATTNPSGTGGVANFNICITNSATTPPSNDACANAQSLTSSTTCNNISGTLFNSTSSGTPVSGCGLSTAADVWYSFTAQTVFPTITFTNGGIPVGGSNRASVQILSGTCAGLSQLYCSNFSASGSINTANLTIGAIYYIRVFSNQSTTPTSAWTFNLCVVDPTSTVVAETSKSYINVTKNNGGGTIDVGDVLEIRSTIYLSAGTIDSLSFQDTLKAGAGFTYQSGTVALRTNEGKIYPIGSSAYTDATGDDAGFGIGTGVGTDAFIKINMGTGATATVGGQAVATTSLPRGSGRYLVIATYRVIVNGVEGTRINFGGGSFRYRNSATGVFSTATFSRDSLIVYASPTSCPNAVSATNVIGDESNGTFGTATGTNQQNRTASPNTSYIYRSFATNNPQDNFYGVVNNTAPAGTTVNQTLGKPNALRVFNVWDVSGDHTGATDQNKGNPPCNSSLPVSATNPCGYMMVINSSYRTDTAFQFNVANACPNMYYEVSAWFKNVCYKCGADFDGTGSFYGGGDNIYLPTGTGDSSGVKPNIAIKVNNLDYYSTGDLQYQGLGGTQNGSDTLNNWVKRAFVYKTDSVTTSFTLTLRNNAPGAGGNDWAIDDISFKTCSPTLNITPSRSPTYCQNGQVDMSVQVASYYNTYLYYRWERSTDGGNTWSAAPELPGIQTFTYTNISGEFRDTVSYPSIIATSAINGYKYRIKLATTSAGLSSSCSVFNTDDEILITVAPSCPVLPNELLKFNVQLHNEQSLLTWNVKEDNVRGYEIERSTDGVSFSYIGFVNAKGLGGAETGYSFTDPLTVTGKTFYRLKIITPLVNAAKYSNILSVTVTRNNNLEISNLVNPFQTKVNFQLNAFKNEQVELQLTDALGHPLLNKKITVSKGSNAVSFEAPAHLQRGSYLLRIVATSGSIYKIIQKL